MVAVKKLYRAEDQHRVGIAKVGRHHGFTIIEVMAAAVVMALAITTSIVAMQRAFLSLDSARNTTLAGQIMQSEFEKMRLKDWVEVNAYPAGPTNLDIPESFTDSATIAERFKLTRSVEAHPSVADMKVITLAIAWKSYDARPQSRFYTTYYGKNGLYDFFYNSY